MASRQRQQAFDERQLIGRRSTGSQVGQSVVLEVAADPHQDLRLVDDEMRRRKRCV